MNKLRMAVLGVLALLGSHANAQTTVTQWGLSATTSYADCSAAVDLIFQSCNTGNLLFGFWIPTVSTQSGGLGETFAQQLNVQQIHQAGTDNDFNMGTTSALVQLDNDNVSVPVLKAEAQSTSDKGWVSALAFGIQGFLYSGVAPATFTLNTALSGTITNPVNAIIDPVGSISDVTGFSTAVWLLAPDAVTFPSVPAATLGELVNSVLTSATVVDSWEPADFNSSGLVDENAILTIDVNPGDEFYLMAGLTASAAGAGRSADAFSTLTMDFVDSTGLTPAGVAAVPEPETYAMMLIGIGLVGWQLQRKSRRIRAHRLC